MRKSDKIFRKFTIDLTALTCSKLISGLITIIITPVYFYLLGSKNFGLIGVFTVLRSILTVSDLGLTKSITRIISTSRGDSEKIISACRTYEILFWLLSMGLGLVLLIFQNDIIIYISDGEKSHSIITVYKWIVLSVCIIVPLVFYDAILMGLEHQKLRAGLSVFNLILYHLMGCFALLIGEGKIDYYFKSVAISAMISIAVSKYKCIDILGKLSAKNVVFDISIFINNYRYTLGAFFISITGVLMNQIDKIILIGLIDSNSFGYYMLAVSLVGVFQAIIGPMHSVTFPVFSKFYSNELNRNNLPNFYHKYSQINTTLIVTPAIMLILNSHEIIYLWTGSITTANAAYQVCSLLVLAKLPLFLIRIPASLQQAYGITSFTILCNIAGLLICLFFCKYLVDSYGMIGGVIAQIPQNLIYIIILGPIVHYMIIQNEGKKWILNDIIIPIVITSSAAYLLLSAWPVYENKIFIFIRLCVIGIICILLCALSCNEIRNILFKKNII